MFSFLKQVVSVLQFPDMLIVIKLFYGTEKGGRVQLGNVQFESVCVSRGTEVYLKLGME